LPAGVGDIDPIHPDEADTNVSHNITRCHFIVFSVDRETC
jgi:hypothetical protein